mgnify:CR=1 FL=1
MPRASPGCGPGVGFAEPLAPSLTPVDDARKESLLHRVVAGRVELLESLHPDKLLPSTDVVPERFELGTLPYELLAGTSAAVEYAVMLALIIVLCIVVIRQVGTSASRTFSTANSAIS